MAQNAAKTAAIVLSAQGKCLPRFVHAAHEKGGMAKLSRVMVA